MVQAQHSLLAPKLDEVVIVTICRWVAGQLGQQHCKEGVEELQCGREPELSIESDAIRGAEILPDIQWVPLLERSLLSTVLCRKVWNQEALLVVFR